MILFEKLLAKEANTYIRFSDENVEDFCVPSFDKNKDVGCLMMKLQA